VGVEGPLVQVWDAHTGKVLASFRHPATVSAAALNPGATRLLSSTETNVYLWDAASGKQLRILPHPSLVSHIEFSLDGRYAISCSRAGAMMKRFAQIWDGDTGARIGSPLWHNDGVYFASFSPDGKKAVTASEDRSAVVWEVPTGRMIGSPLIHKHQVLVARFSEDSRWVVTLDYDNRVQVWDATTSSPITPQLRHHFPIEDVQFIANGRQVLAKSTKPGQWTDWANPADPQPALWRSWDLAPDPRPVEDMVRVAQLLSGRRDDQISGGLPLGREALRACWSRLNTLYPSDFKVSPEEIAAWHRREAEASEKASQWNAAVFHWGQLQTNRPNDPFFEKRLAIAREKYDAQSRRQDN
jgi:hypothetical protein